jgi:alkylhydroperoxidase family enzyme
MLMILLSRNTLPLRLREMIVMRIGWRTRSEYQWYQHYQICTTQAGFSDEDVLAIRDWRNPEHAARLQPADRAMLAAVDDTIDQGGISDEVWAECAQHITEPAMQVEMVMAIGYWIMLSQFFQTFQVPLQEGAKLWPPDGKAPPPRG